MSGCQFEHFGDVSTTEQGSLNDSTESADSSGLVRDSAQWIQPFLSESVVSVSFLQSSEWIPGSLAAITQGLRIRVGDPVMLGPAPTPSPRFGSVQSGGTARRVAPLYRPFTHACSRTGGGSSSRLRWFTSSARVCARFQHVDGPLEAGSLSSVNIAKRPPSAA